MRAAMLLVLFPAVQTKTMVTRSLLPISTVACKGPFCVEVLRSFYGRFFVEEGQFINSTSSLLLCRHFFYFLTPPRFGALNRESESSRSQPVYRKLFLRGPHSSKNNFFEIKISRPTALDSLSVLLWLLTWYKTLLKSRYQSTILGFEICHFFIERKRSKY